MRALLLGLVPLLLLFCGVRSLPPEPPGQPAGQRRVYEVPPFRTVVIILDSVGTPMAFNPQLMPYVSSMMTDSLFGEAEACPGNATFPCVKSIFEGRTATTGTALQDFSAVASNRTTWPRSLAALGHRLAVTSDHTLNRLYPDAFVEAMNYESLSVPLMERDLHAYRQAEKWLDDPQLDVLILHIVGTDTVSHKHEVGGPEYQAKFREADEFVRTVASRLQPEDYLYVIGDHGHNELGGHTSDAAYLVRGPLFPRGRHQNLRAADMLFLLSVPYALTLPDHYEGEVRTDLTLLGDEARRKLLEEQARLWRIESDSVPDRELEARLNQHVLENRARIQHAHGTDMLSRVAPWLLGAALFLIGEWSLRTSNPRRQSRAAVVVAGLFVAGVGLGLGGIPAGGWLVVLAALWRSVDRLGGRTTALAVIGLGLVGALVFWVLPSGHQWFFVRRNQPLAFVAFYLVAGAAAIAFTLLRGAATPRQHLVRILWVIGVAIWLLAYFGPSTAALTGRGVKVVLAIFAPVVIVAAGGWRTLLAWPTLCLAAVFPFMDFHTDSFNIHYRLFDRLAEFPPALIIALCGLLAFLLLLALIAWSNDRTRMPAVASIAGTACGVAWMLLALVLFEFTAERLLGCLLGALWLAGCLVLFRRAGVSPAWSALTSVILLFGVFHFLLDGFALSHVDFRFATDKIIPFQQEWLRAPQVIVWAAVKYLFVMLPIFAVLLFVLPRQAALPMLQLSWWRTLMIVVSALGLALFDARGVSELCREEIYFWTFLDVALWLFCLVTALLHRSATPAAAHASLPAGRVAAAR